MNANNYTRVKAEALRQGDTIVMFAELTGEPYAVGLKSRKVYEGTKGTIEFETSLPDLRLIFDEPKTQEAMRCQ